MIYVNETVWAERDSDIHSYYMYMDRDVDGMCTMTKLGLLFSRMRKDKGNMAFDTFAAIVPDGGTFRFVSCHKESGDVHFESRLLADDASKLSLATKTDAERNMLATEVFTDYQAFIDARSSLVWWGIKNV